MPRVGIRLLAIALVATFAPAVSGCGTGPSMAVSDARPVTIAMAEFALDPQDLELTPGPRELVIRNAGTMVHRFRLHEADGRRVLVGRHLRPGESERIAVDLAPGEYVIRCGQERHNTLGEHGRIRVR